MFCVVRLFIYALVYDLRLRYTTGAIPTRTKRCLKNRTDLCQAVQDLLTCRLIEWLEQKYPKSNRKKMCYVLQRLKVSARGFSCVSGRKNIASKAFKKRNKT